MQPHAERAMYRGTAMKLPHLSARHERGCVAPTGRTAAAVVAIALLGGCEQNSFVPPPPPKVEVAAPVQRPVTRYLEATGNTAATKTVDLVARVQGFLQSIDYQDGSFVKQGATLFEIEPETYRLKLDQAKA